MIGFPLRAAARFTAAFSRIFFSATAAATFLLGADFTILVAAGLAGAVLARADAIAEVADAADLTATFAAGTGLFAADFAAADFAGAGTDANGFAANGFAATGFAATGFAANGFAATGFAANGFAATGFAATGFADAIGLPLTGAATAGVDTDFAGTLLVGFAVATAVSPPVDFLAKLRPCPVAFDCMFVFAI